MGGAPPNYSCVRAGHGKGCAFAILPTGRPIEIHRSSGRRAVLIPWVIPINNPPRHRRHRRGVLYGKSFELFDTPRRLRLMYRYRYSCTYYYSMNGYRYLVVLVPVPVLGRHSTFGTTQHSSKTTHGLSCQRHTGHKHTSTVHSRSIESSTRSSTIHSIHSTQHQSNQDPQ